MMTGGFGINRLGLEAAHGDGTPNHLRFGEVAAEHNMNYVADATFANIRFGGRLLPHSEPAINPVLNAYAHFLAKGTSSPAILGRYLKESGAAYRAPTLPPETRPLKATWTEVPAKLWFGNDRDSWLGDSPDYKPLDDRDGNGLRDVRIDLELWQDAGTPGPGDDTRLAAFSRAGAANRIPAPGGGRIYYKAVFVNDWDLATRLNSPLDVTPFLDDVTLACAEPGGARLLAWGPEEGN
jgi:hypothetical protein